MPTRTTARRVVPVATGRHLACPFPPRAAPEQQPDGGVPGAAGRHPAGATVGRPRLWGPARGHQPLDWGRSQRHFVPQGWVGIGDGVPVPLLGVFAAGPSLIPWFLFLLFRPLRKYVCRPERHQGVHTSAALRCVADGHATVPCCPMDKTAAAAVLRGRPRRGWAGNGAATPGTPRERRGRRALVSLISRGWWSGGSPRLWRRGSGRKERCRTPAGFRLAQ